MPKVEQDALESPDLVPTPLSQAEMPISPSILAEESWKDRGARAATSIPTSHKLYLLLPLVDAEPTGEAAPSLYLPIYLPARHFNDLLPWHLHTESSGNGQELLETQLRAAVVPKCPPQLLSCCSCTVPEIKIQCSPH